MKIGVPKEIKQGEGRVGLLPTHVLRLKKSGHEIFVEKDAGLVFGMKDEDYAEADAKITTAEQAWNTDMVIKVKEPLESEIKFLKANLILFTFLHLASNIKLIEDLKNKGVTAIDYSTIELEDGSLPILKPMSGIAGEIAAQNALKLSEKNTGKKNVEALVLGGGTAGLAAAMTILLSNEKNRVLILEKEKVLCHNLSLQRIKCREFSPNFLRQCAKNYDILIGAVLVPGMKAPKIITEETVKTMKPGSVIADISIDQGGCCETSRPTSHENPTFEIHGVTHYCVPNIPGGSPKASLLLTKITFPFVKLLADKGFEQAVIENPALAKGVNIHKGRVVHPALAETADQEYTPLKSLL